MGLVVVMALVFAACSGGSGTEITSTTAPEITTSTAPPAGSTASTVTGSSIVTTTLGVEGFCPTVEAALAWVEAAQEENPDPELEDVWSLLRSFYLRLEPVAPAELEEDIALILQGAEHFEARARDPEGVPSPTEEEGDAFNAAIAEVMAYVETECGIPTIELVPLG